MPWEGHYIDISTVQKDEIVFQVLALSSAVILCTTQILSLSNCYDAWSILPCGQVRKYWEETDLKFHFCLVNCRHLFQHQRFLTKTEF